MNSFQDQSYVMSDKECKQVVTLYHDTSRASANNLEAAKYILGTAYGQTYKHHHHDIHVNIVLSSSPGCWLILSCTRLSSRKCVWLSVLLARMYKKPCLSASDAGVGQLWTWGMVTLLPEKIMQCLNVWLLKSGCKCAKNTWKPKIFAKIHVVLLEAWTQWPLSTVSI